MSLFSFTSLSELALLQRDRFILPGEPEPLWLRLAVELERARREARNKALSTAAAASPLELPSIPGKGERNARPDAERAA